MNRAELAEFLTVRRGKLKPRHVGLPEGPGRRTPGLRRQEVAQLAGMSIDYYIRLEQARGPRPSRQVLSALSRALLLDIDERAYLFHLVGETPEPGSRLGTDVPSGILNLLHALTDVPGYVVDAKYDVLAWNDLASKFMGQRLLVPEQRNVVRVIFTGPGVAAHLATESGALFARACVADLRAAAARYPDDHSITDLVEDLLRISPEFGELWAEHEVVVRRAMRKTMTHPVVGEIDVECQILLVPDRDQRLILYVAEPGSPSHQAIQALSEGVDKPAGALSDMRSSTVCHGPKQSRFR